MTSAKQLALDQIESKKAIINFEDFTDAEKQAWCDFTAHEIERHRQDIFKASDELKIMALKYNIVPRDLYLHTYIEVK